ncbi:hypothetical protein [Aquisphaera insulae]|uniref:hypothetical protein n=1 Tax=Aquisphaera insulae TaxID=2712864 RepID=UPI0013EB5882|nr:hypothetical protein [Aquisphaera insulae]
MIWAFLVIAFVLAVIATVGHLLWIGARAVILAVTRSYGDSRPGPIEVGLCPRCGETVVRGPRGERCILCDWSKGGWPPSARPDVGRVLDRLCLRVRRYQDAGLISVRLRDRLIELIRAETPPQALAPSRPEVAEPKPGPEPAEIVFWEAAPEPARPSVESTSTVREGIAARARDFAAAMARREVERPAEVSPTRPPKPPAQPLSKLLSAFLEEKNIRWGELVGGLLIVGCSLALVISFWASIAERPWLKFGLFNGVTAALFAVGFHAQRSWRLPTTARGLLEIACLLTPLNMLAVASFARGTAESPAVWLGEIAVIGLFAMLCLGAGRYLVGHAPWALAVGVVAPSASMFLIGRLAGPGSTTGASLALGVLPLAAQAAAMGGLLRAVRRDPDLDEPAAQGLLRGLGLGSFAVVLALGLLITRCGTAAAVLRPLAPLLPLAAAPGLATGLWLWRRATARELAAYRTAGTSIAAAAVLVSLAAVVIPWPAPAEMMLGAGLNAALLLTVALVLEIPAAHAAAGLCVAVVYLLGWLMLTGRLPSSATSPEALTALLSRSSGLVLMPLVLACLGVVATASRRGKSLVAQAYGLVAGLVAAVSIGLVAWHGLGIAGDPTGASWVFAAYAVIAIACAAWFSRWPLFETSGGLAEVRTLAGIGSALSFAALGQGLVFGLRERWGLTAPWLDVLLAHPTLTLGAMAGLERFGVPARDEAHSARGRSRFLRDAGPVLERTLLPAVVLASALWLWLLPWTPMSSLAGHAAWLAVVWLAMAWRADSPAAFAAFQASLTAAVACVVGGWLEGRPWFRGGWSWLDPRSVQALGMAMAVLGLGWIAIRRMVVRGPETDRLRTLLHPAWPAFDRVFRGVPIAMVVGLALYASLPGVFQELSPRGGMRVVSPAVLFEIPGIPHAPAIGAGSWVLLVLALAMVLAEFSIRGRRSDLMGAILIGWLAAPLLAGNWEGDVAAASALRWSSSLYGLAVSALLWGRDRRARLVGPGGESILRGLAFSPALLIFGYATLAAMAGAPVVGPAPGTLFARMGSLGSYLPPVLLLAIVHLGCSIRERSSRLAFASALVLEAAATLGFLLAGIESGMGLGGGFVIRLAHVDAAVAAGFAMAWLGVLAGSARRSGSTSTVAVPDVLTVLVGLGAGLNLIVLALGTSSLWFDPMPTSAVRAMADPLGWAAFGLAVAAVVVHSRVAGRPLGSGGLGMGLVAGGAMLALGRAAGDAGDWRTYHEMLANQAVAGLLLLLAGWYRAGRSAPAMDASARRAVAAWSTLSLGIVVLYSVRGYVASSPQYPWWTLGGLAASVATAVGLALWTLRRPYLAAAAVLINLAMTLAWCASAWWTASMRDGVPPVDLLNVNALGLALPVPLWIWLGRRLSPSPSRLARVAVWLALGALGLGVTIALARPLGPGHPPYAWPGCLALAATAAAFAAGFWDRSARGSLRGLYLLGLCAVGWVLVPFPLSDEMLVWLGSIVLAAYAVLTSYLWSRRDLFRGLANRLGIEVPAVDEEAGPVPLLMANLAIITAVVGLSFGTILSSTDVIRRSCAADAVLASTLSVGLLAHGRRRSALQAVALGLGVVGAVAWGWAWLDPRSVNASLDRVVVTFAALVAGAVAYGLGLAKFLPRFSEWTSAARRLVPALLVLALGALIVVLGAEVAAAVGGETAAISAWAVILVAATFALASAAALLAAVVPGRDPLGLTERGRTAYVYGAEALLAILVLHLKLAMPWLFGGFLARYMSLILLGLAFVGVGLSELFRRQGRRVLSEPLERTGVFLPFLPLAKGLWSTPDPAQSVVFFTLAGGLYALLSALRSSLVFSALSALAFNAAIWTMLGQVEGLGLMHHPQLWVIPPALCAVVGAYWNRDRLTESQLAATRYAAAVAIYVSSLGDIALTGVAQAPWLPGVLALLGIGGIFAGIWLRVRGFLYLGFGAVCLAIFTITWYAAVDLQQSWLWWAAGIAAGVLILALFGLFEKKREEILKVVDELKGWNP